MDKELWKQITPARKAIFGAIGLALLLYVALCAWISMREDPYRITLSVTSVTEHAALPEGDPRLDAGNGKNAEVPDYTAYVIHIENDANRMLSSQNDMRTYLVCRPADGSGAFMEYTSDEVKLAPRIGSGQAGDITFYLDPSELPEGTETLIFDLKSGKQYFSELSDSFTPATVRLHP